MLAGLHKGLGALDVHVAGQVGLFVAQRRDDCGQVHHHVDAFQRPAYQCRVTHVAPQDLDPVAELAGHLAGVGIVKIQTAHLAFLLEQGAHGVAADIAECSGDKDLHS